MPIWLKNFQSKVFFNENLLKMHCCFLLNAFGTGKYDISVVCVSTRRIQHLNKTYRRDDTPTDVLSFPYHENIEPGTLPSPERQCDYNLGDIILGLPYIYQQCQEERVQPVHRLPILVTHGICHLLGYDHKTPKTTKQMISKEYSILTTYNNTFGTNLKPLTFQ